MVPLAPGTIPDPNATVDGLTLRLAPSSDADKLPSSSELAQSLFTHGFTSTHSDTISKSEALRWAVKEKQAQLVRQLLDEGADVDQMDEDSWTSLHFATLYFTCGDILNMILAAGANVAAETSRGFTALHTAAWAPKPEAVRLLVSHGLSLESRSHDGYTPLHLAAKEGCIESIQILLDAKTDTECEDAEGNTPLHFACDEGHLEAVRLLIDGGSFISSRNHNKRTPLHMAALRGQTDCVRHLIDAGADIKLTDVDGRTALHFVVVSSSLITARALLEYDIDIEARDEEGETPLVTAVIQNSVEMAGILIENKANLETTTVGEQQPLHLAVLRGFIQMIQLLLENGADIEARNEVGWTPLLAAARLGKIEMVRLMIDNGADMMASSKGGDYAIQLALASQSKPLIRFLIQQGVPVDVRHKKTGNTPLMEAARNGNPEMVSLLIQQCADVNAANKMGWTPLHFAARGGHERVVEILLENDGNPIAETAKGSRPSRFSDHHGHDAITKLLNDSTPVTRGAIQESKARSAAALLHVVRRGQLARVIQMIDKGVDINALDIDGRNALSVAAEHGYEDLVLTLVEMGATVDMQDANGSSPLWWASRYGHETIVKLLLDHEASINTIDADGQSPLCVASQQGHLATVKTLLERGADADLSTKYGKTALIFAILNGQQDLVELLLRFGADPRYTTPQGDTPLSLAKRNGYAEIENIIRAAPKYYLIDSGGLTNGDDLSVHSLSSSSTIDPKYTSMLSTAAGEGRLAEIERLIEMGADPNGYVGDETPLYKAARLGQRGAVETLVELGAHIFHPTNAGKTALTAAARGGHVSIIESLYQLGRKLQLKVDPASGPLLEAAKEGQKEAAALLLDLGANTELRDAQGCTSLWHAGSNGCIDVVDLLLIHGANVESADKSGCTPLMAAINNRHRKVTALFLEKGAQMRPESIQNFSPLCSAVSTGDESIVDLLVHHGVDLNYASDNKRTALHLAVLQGNTMVVKMLIEAGAKVDLEDADGRTALSLAKEMSHDSAVKLLYQARSLRQASHRAARKAEQQGLEKKAFYQYRPLTEANFIRVLELHPGKPGDVLRFDLNEVQIHVNASYEALSYEWLEKKGSVPVQCNNERLDITPNCKAAMERLRLDSGPRYLWIDAICIDQENIQERNQQVAIMTDIYRAAKKVLMWLGEEKESTRTAFEALPMMAKAHDLIMEASGELSLEGLSVGEDDDPRQVVKRLLGQNGVIEALSDLLRRTYWTRAWIFQEIVLAGSRGVAICGSQHCEWTILKRALLLSRQHTSTPWSPIFRVNWIEDRRSSQGFVSLGDATWALSTLNATDSRDKVFASLGLASANGKSSVEWPVADYTMTEQQVFLHATRHIIDVENISWTWRLGVPHKVPRLPSWVPDFNPRDEMMRLNPFPNSKLLFKLNDVDKPSTTESSLYIDGCIVDKVVFKLTITKEYDAYGIIRPVVRALARQGGSIYDAYPLSKEIESSRDTDEASKPGESVQRVLRNTNAMALFDTMMDLRKIPVGQSPAAVDEYHQMLIGYLTWSLSQDKKAPSRSRQAPDYARKARKEWLLNTHDDINLEDYELTQLKIMEEMFRYNKDLIYTENGFFGLTNSGQAKEGLSVALIGDTEEFRLLEEKQDGERYYEYVDVVYLNTMEENIDKLKRICKEPKIERLELR